MLTDEIIYFFQKQGFVIASTTDKDGTPHNSCKGIVKIDKNKNEIYLLDLYKTKTHENLKRDTNISITAVDEHKFIGYCIKGRAKTIKKDRLKPHIVKAWEERIVHRVTDRIIKNIHGEKGHPRHPEILLPKPEYLIIVQVKEVVDLTPHALK
ncbi:MAG: pyridoxamine 5'-phosphate oxidase family protein [Candidatus Omnitrophota bacterium]|nr:MAG: pyridoxamine 5'-phosphate oxidase family protein [Candidatus Omnitrophota bacterium]